MIETFVNLFSEADVLFYILFTLAIILLIAEVFIASFGIVGMMGALSGFGAVLERCLTTDNSTTENVLYITYIAVIMIVAVGIVKIFYKMATKIKQKKKFAIVDGNKIPFTKDGFLDYSFMVGKEGVVVSDLKPLGKAEFDGRVFEVTTTKEYIYSGTHIRVDKIVNQRIVVKKKY